MKPAISQCCGNRRAEDQLSLRVIGGAKDHSEDDRFELVDTSYYLSSSRGARELRGLMRSVYYKVPSLEAEFGNLSGIRSGGSEAQLELVRKHWRIWTRRRSWESCESDSLHAARQSRSVCVDPSVMTWRARTKELRGIYTPTKAYGLQASACKFPWLAAMWLLVTALTSDHLWRRNCDGHSTCVL